MHLMAWLTDPDDAKILLGISFLMNYVLIDQLVLNLVDICLDNTLQVLHNFTEQKVEVDQRIEIFCYIVI